MCSMPIMPCRARQQVHCQAQLSACPQSNIFFTWKTQHIHTLIPQVALCRTTRRHVAPQASSNPGSSNSPGSKGSGGGSSPTLVERAVKFVDSQVQVILLLSMMGVGLAAPAAGVAAAQAGLAKAVTVAIFVVAGLQLRRGEALTALSAVGCVAWGMASILLLTPLFALPLLALPLEPRALCLGTAVFACMPTTLSSGINMTTAAGGNTALAILLTLATNTGGVFTLPWVMPRVLGGSVGDALQPMVLLRQLVETVLLPTLAGAAARALVPGVAAAVDGNRRAVMYFSAACLATVPWMQVSKTAASGSPVGGGALLLAAALGGVLHLAFLAFNWVAASVLDLGGGKGALQQARLKQALVLQASQKTLPVAVAVISSPALAPALGAGGAGIASLAAVAAHLTQVLIDSFMIPVWTNYIRRAAQQEAASKPRSD